MSESPPNANSIPPTPPLPMIFRIAFGHRCLAWFSVVALPLMFLGSLLSWYYPGFLEGPDGPTPWWIPLIFLGLSGLAPLFLCTTLQRIIVSQQGIQWSRPFSATRSLNWNQIKSIREIPHRQELELQGPAGHASVNVPSLIENYSSLRDLILVHCPNAKTGTTDIKFLDMLPATFRKRPTVRTIEFALAGLILIFGIWSYFSTQVDLADDPWPVLIIGAGLVWFARLAWSWHALIVETDRLLLQALLRSRAIMFSTIDAVQLLTIQQKRKGVVAVHTGLRLQLKSGETLDCEGFIDMIHAHQLIEAALSKHRAS